MTDESLKKAKEVWEAIDISKCHTLFHHPKDIERIIRVIAIALDEMRPQWPSKEEQDKAHLLDLEKYYHRTRSKNVWDSAIDWLKSYMEKK